MIITDDAPTLHDLVMLYGYDMDDILGNYPIWDEGKREWLNSMIYRHFAYREIAAETPQEYAFLMARTMAEMSPSIMPLFKALDSEFDILNSYENTSTSDDTTTADGKQLYSATPQTQLSGEENYATNLTDTNNITSSANKTESSGRNAPVGDMLTSWMQSVNNALYIVYNGLEPLHQQILVMGGVASWQ